MDMGNLITGATEEALQSRPLHTQDNIVAPKGAATNVAARVGMEVAGAKFKNPLGQSR